MKSLLTALLFIPLLAACGKKGPPLPPEGLVPERISGFSARGERDGLVLSWAIPRKNNDGTTLNDLAGFKVYRKISGEGCNNCPSEFPLYTDIDIEAPGGAIIQGDRVSLALTQMEEGLSYSFKVAPYNKDGYVGEFSELLTIKWGSPLSPPEGVTGKTADRSITLLWEPSASSNAENFAGYFLYRADTPGSYSGPPLNAVPTTVENYTDIGLENDKAYYYVVKTVAKDGKTLTEGAPSEEIPLIPRDLIPPLPPAGLSVVPTKSGVKLFWKQSEDLDLLGYNVYRRAKGAASQLKLNDAPLTTEDYNDETATAGRVYYYSLTAVDNAPSTNESEHTAEVYTIVPDFKDLTN